MFRVASAWLLLRLGTPVAPFFPFYFWVFLSKRNIRKNKKGTPIIEGTLGNLGGLATTWRTCWTGVQGQERSVWSG